MSSERDLSLLFCVFLKSLNLFLQGFLLSVLWSGKNNSTLNVRCSHQRYNTLPSQKEPSPVRSIAIMRQMHIHGLKILGISFLIDMYHFFLCSPAVNWSLARCNLVHRGGNKPGSARGQDNRSHFYRGSPASPCNYKPPSILQSNFKKVEPSFLSLCNHKCSVFLKTFINAILPCPCPHN